MHLLRDAGLIRSTWSPVDGRGRLYAIVPKMHGPITAWLGGTEVGRPIGLTIDDDWNVHDG